MPACILSPEEWLEVRRAVESGVEMSEAARHFGIDYQAIKKKAQRQEWMTKRVREDAIQEHKAKLAVSPSVPKPTALAVITASRAENVELLKDEGIKWGLKVVQNAGKSLTTPNSFADVKAAVDVAAKLAGIGQDSGAGVTILFGGSPSSLVTRNLDSDVQVTSDLPALECDDLA